MFLAATTAVLSGAEREAKSLGVAMKYVVLESRCDTSKYILNTQVESV